jgi:hypothetical protein
VGSIPISSTEASSGFFQGRVSRGGALKTMRTLMTVVFMLSLAGCGEDGSPDMSCIPMTGTACEVAGRYCQGFENYCTCGNDLVWHCSNPGIRDLAMTSDLSTHD